MKTGKDLLIDDKFFENTVISKRKGEEFYASSPNPILKRYIDEFEYTQQDGVQIQKLINYCVVTYIKTDRQKNLMNNIKRWKYVRDVVNEFQTYFPQYNFNLKAFKEMKNELVEILFA
jgi:uncharacterized protein YlbG (UPF0298 family)